MSRSTLAGLAFACAIAIAASDATPSAGQQAGPPRRACLSRSRGMSLRREGPAGGPGFIGERGGRFIGPGRGEMMGMGPERGEMMHRMMMHRTPQERCLHRVARRAGMVAYTGTMLNLTPDQRPIWFRLNDVIQQNLQKAQHLCAGLGQGPGQETPARPARPRRTLCFGSPAGHPADPAAAATALSGPEPRAEGGSRSHVQASPERL